MSNITLNIDDGLKEASERLFSELGFSFSSVVNAFLRQAVREQEVSFRLRERELSDRTLTAEALTAFNELRMQAKDVPEMSIDEINAEITATREEKRTRDGMLCSD